MTHEHRLTTKSRLSCSYFRHIAHIQFLLLKTGLFKMKMNINIDLFYLNIPPVKLKVRISPATICLVIAWFTGLNQQIRIPAWIAILIIFVVLPSLYETLLRDQ